MKIQMNLISTTIILTLIISGCSNNFETIKLVCEGEGENKVKKAFEIEEITPIKEERTYLITTENEKIYTNENNDQKTLKETRKKVYTIKFKSFFGETKIIDGTSYIYRGEGKDSKTEESSYKVNINEDSITASRRNNFKSNNYSNDIPQQTDITLDIEIDRVSGKFIEKYSNTIDYSIPKRVYIHSIAIKGTCKKVDKNQI